MKRLDWEAVDHHWYDHRDGDFGSYRSRNKKTSNFEELPEREGMTRAYSGWREGHHFRDSVTVRFLSSMVGRHMDEVMSELRKRVNPDTKGGMDVLESVKWKVDFGHEHVRSRWYGRPFYVDESGILRKQKNVSRHAYWDSLKKQQKEVGPLHIDGSWYEKLGDIWYRVTYTRKKYWNRKQAPLIRIEKDGKFRHPGYYETPRIGTTESPVFHYMLDNKKQLSKKELKKLNLHND